MPWEAWYFGRGAKPGAPSPFKWTYHFGFGVEEFHKAYVSQWNLIETNKKVGVMYPNDADGNAIRAHLAPALAKAGFTIVDPGAYETGTTDFTAQIALFRQEGVEIFNSFPIPPDFAAFWRQAAQQGLTQQIKICQVAKTGLFPSDIEALGDLGMVLVGGIGKFEGAILGAILFFLIETFFGGAGVWYLIGLGATALIFSLYLPRGLWGEVERRFDFQLLPVGYRLKLPGPIKINWKE